MTSLELILPTIILLAAISILWSTLTTGISPMMSSAKARQAMLAEIQQPADGPMIDLGSGWGTLVIAAARKFPQQQVIGYELSWLPWLVSSFLQRFYGLSNLTIHRKDFRAADIHKASTLLCYLFPAGMDALAKRLASECTGAMLIVSNTFALPGLPSTKTLRLDDIYRTPIYVYHWPPTNLRIADASPKQSNLSKVT
ncbi:methyltransferase [Simiduia aestuariiviva]|uniref:Methyltransferase small domain-containing protein n=1 Tax=Simiduia aestuariiviva TaxID=1510459 RepID=A0A839UVZ7_9GAMM|nr:methyltransferase [Simiduia aestuariiviva]MBB3169505.1 hypothetical protein [Simiduia aestuariiviva]